MKLRLMEHPTCSCGCSTVQGGQGLKVRACLCVLHSGAKCLSPQSGTYNVSCNGAAVKLRLME